MSKDSDGLPLISGHFAERTGLQRAYYDEPAVSYIKFERIKQSLDEKDLNTKIKLEVEHQIWLKEKEINGRLQSNVNARPTPPTNPKT